MELKNDSIREVIQKEGIKSANSKFKKEDITSELKKDFELVKEILSSQPSSAFKYCIHELLPAEVSRLFEKEILDFWENRVLQENPNLNKEEVAAEIKKDFDKSVVRKEFTEKGDAYQALYRRMEFVIEEYGQEKLDAFLNTQDPKLRQNLIEWGRIQENNAEPVIVAEEEQKLEEKPPVVEEEKKTEEKAPAVEEEKKTEEKAPVVEKETKPEEKLSAAEKQPKEEAKKEPTQKRNKIDVSKLSPKAKKLIKKIKDLCDKSMNEKDIVKKHLLRFKIRMLASKVQKEIDLYNLKEEYKIKAEELKATKDQKQKDDMKAIILINQKIRQRERILQAYPEYDYQSSDFMFPKSTIESYGGINQFTETLKKEDNVTMQDTGKRMADSVRYREEIKILKKQLEDRQRSMEIREKESTRQMDALDSIEKDKRLIMIKGQKSIFNQMKVFFQNAKKTIQDFSKDLSERKRIDAEYRQKEEELRLQYDLKVKQLRQEAESAKNPSSKKSETEFNKRLKENVKTEPTNQKANPENAAKPQPKQEPVEHSEH